MSGLFGQPERAKARVRRNIPPPDPIMSQPQPHTNGTKTSDLSAKQIKPIFPGRIKFMLELFAAADRCGLTDEEGQHVSELGGDSWRPARGRMVEQGMVEKTTTTRRTKRGRQALVFKITEKGREAAGR